MSVAVGRPSRVVTPLTTVYWSAAERGELLLQRCLDCGKLQHYPRSICAACWGDSLEWTAASGDGVVEAFTDIHMPGHPSWRDETPYAIAIVELDEGPRVLVRLTDSLPVGARVRLVPAGDSPEAGIHWFQPAAGA